MPAEVFTTKCIALSKNKGTSLVNGEGDIRPIGVSNIVTKIFEKAFISWSNQWPEIFASTAEQAGCVQGRNALQHVYALLTTMQMDWSNKSSEAVYAFMDLKAAFDRVRRQCIHLILEKKLKEAEADATFSSIFRLWLKRQFQQSASCIGQFMFATSQGVT